jgi:hypothetical protein
VFCGCAERIAAGVCDVADWEDAVCPGDEASVDAGAAGAWPLEVWVIGDALIVARTEMDCVAD